MGIAYRRMVRFCLAGMMALSIVPPSAHAEAPLQSEVEDESVKQHELFEFEASIKHGDIVDGTEGFDSNDEPGNDSGPHNGIVRSWDSVTYPLKVTINPKKADKLEKIKLKISGELENGVTGARINAKFAVGGKEDVNGKKVSFVQEYTIERTGNSIMIPVAIEVLGAKPGVNLTPKLQVQVVSVDGVTIEKDNVVTAFHDLPGITVSSKVSIKPYVNSGLYRNGIPNYPYSRISGDPDDKRNMHAFSLSWSIANLPGKSNFRGATFPDPEGKINFRIELEGEVAWDQPARTEKLDFDGRDTPFMMIDHRPISFIHNAVGSKNTLMDGISYRFDKSPFYGAPLSQLANMNESETRRSVWDSGEWEVTKPDQGKHVVTYEGSNTGYVIGSTFPRYEAGGFTGYSIFNANDRFFASHSFLVLLPNEYRIGGPNNQDDKGNNVNYKATATLLSYTDENGTNIPLANPLKSSMFFTERNNPKGAYATHGTFQGNPSGRWLGTPNVGWHSVSKGDASSLLGEDVFFHVDLGPQVTSYGGYRAVYRWNTDAFELTEKYAKDAENILYDNGYITPMLHEVRNNRETQQVLYGVPKFTDNEFRNFTSKGINDYEWFATFAQAKATGKPIGAIQRNITAPVGPGWRGGGRVPLRVKHENIGIGSKTKNGTANVAVVNWYVYPKEDRSMMIDISEGRAYHNPAIWDENGTMLQKQSPSGSTINFETLAVVPAETSSVLTSDKSSYYNSETIKWTVDNSIVLPESGVPDNLDAGVTVKNTLPAGLDYKAGSGKAGNQVTEPEIMRHPDGSKTLVWRLLVSNSNRSIPRVTFETTINPFALDTNGVQSSIEVKSVIESELDKRQEHLRTTTKSVTILKVGMVGIYESIDKTYGDKNSDFTLTLSPYTTIEDEQGVTGLTHLPLSGDRLGSEYSGTAKIKAINQTIERRHNEPVRIFLNHQPVHSTHPNEIDTSTGGWYEYTGNAGELDGAVSLLFYVEGKMTNRDTIKIDVQIQTEGNGFGDQYLSETVINSDTDYRLSPVSNRVKYTIRADLELKLERFQIYTNKADRGLPTSIRVAQNVLEAEAVSEKPITLAIYDRATGNKVADKTFKQSELRRENAILIPPDILQKGEKRNFIVRLEGYDEDSIWVRDGEGSLDTDGYASKEGTLTLSDADRNGIIAFEGVVMTERELGKDMASFKESLNIPAIPEPSVKSGYGFSLPVKTEYTNELLADVSNRIQTTFDPNVRVEMDGELLDESLDYPDGASGSEILQMDGTETTGPNKVTMNYKLPQVFLDRKSGLTYTAIQKENCSIPGDDVLDAGHRVYVPVWIREAGAYNAAIKSGNPVGSHFMRFDIDRSVHVKAYMFNHTDSETPDDDELLLHPMKQGDIPSDW